MNIKLMRNGWGAPSAPPLINYQLYKKQLISKKCIRAHRKNGNTHTHIYIYIYLYDMLGKATKYIATA